MGADVRPGGPARRAEVRSPEGGDSAARTAWPETGRRSAPAPKISILIVHYRSPQLLETCLRTIAQAGVQVPYEVLVIDNDPLDEAAGEITRRHRARYLRNRENLGYGKAVNQGLAAGRGEQFLILNPDVEVLAGGLEALSSYLDEHPGVGLVGPKLYSPDGSLQYSARTFYTLKTILLRRTFLGKLFPHSATLREHLMMDWDHNEAREVDWMLGGALMARREAVEDVGGMDERFFLYFEDVDWCSRMKRRGWQVVYVPAAEMIHAHQRASARGFLSRGKRMHIESALRFYEKWSLVLYLWKRQSTDLRAGATLLADILALSLAFFAAYLTRYLLGVWIPDWSAAKPVFALKVYARFIPFADLIAVGTFYFLGLYRGEVWRDRWCESLQLVKGVGITSIVVMAATFLFTTRPLSRFTILLFFPYSIILLSLARELLRHIVREVRGRQLHLTRLAVFAPREQIAVLKDRFARHGTFGFEPLYLAHDDERRRPDGERIDPLERRVRFLRDERIAQIALFEGQADVELCRRLMPKLLAAGIPVAYVPLGEAFLHEARQIGDFMGFGAVSLGGRPRRVGHWFKRTLDLLAAGLLLLLAAPLHLGQIAFTGQARWSWHERVGRRGQRIRLPAYAAESGLLRAIPGLRHYPSLLAILRGSMSFVGIAALTPEEWEQADPFYRQHPPNAPVGLFTERTLPATERGPAAALEQRLAGNRRYVKGWSLSEDVRIFLQALHRH